MRVLSAVVVGLFCLTAQPVLAADLKSEVEAAYSAWNEAFNKGDAAALASFYTEDAKLLPPSHDVITGPAAVEEFFAGLFAAGVTDHALDVIEVYGDADAKEVTSAATWSATGKAADGSPQKLGGIAVHGFARQPDGALKLNLQTFN
jgi:uncharacterized protein (TIGR02246 family)